MTVSPYSEAVASCFRTIAGALPEVRVKVFETQAVEAFRHAAKAGIEKVQIVDRLEESATLFGWPPDERQRRIAEASKKASEPPTTPKPEKKSRCAAGEKWRKGSPPLGRQNFRTKQSPSVFRSVTPPRFGLLRAGANGRFGTRCAGGMTTRCTPLI